MLCSVCNKKQTMLIHDWIIYCVWFLNWTGRWSDLLNNINTETLQTLRLCSIDAWNDEFPLPIRSALKCLNCKLYCKLTFIRDDFISRNTGNKLVHAITYALSTLKLVYNKASFAAMNFRHVELGSRLWQIIIGREKKRFTNNS